MVPFVPQGWFVKLFHSDSPLLSHVICDARARCVYPHGVGHFGFNPIRADVMLGSTRIRWRFPPLTTELEIGT